MPYWLISQISQCLWLRSCLEYKCKDHPYTAKVNVIHGLSEKGPYQTTQRSLLLIFLSHFQHKFLIKSCIESRPEIINKYKSESQCDVESSDRPHSSNFFLFAISLHPSPSNIYLIENRK